MLFRILISNYRDLNFTAGENFKTDLVCMLAVPTIFNLTDILGFLGPYTDNINGIRIVRDRNPHTFMVFNLNHLLPLLITCIV